MGPRIVQSHAADQIGDLAHDSRSPLIASMHEIPLLSHKPPMPAHQRIGRDDHIEFEQGFAPYGLRLPR